MVSICCPLAPENDGPGYPRSFPRVKHGHGLDGGGKSKLFFPQLAEENHEYGRQGIAVGHAIAILRQHRRFSAVDARLRQQFLKPCGNMSAGCFLQRRYQSKVDFQGVDMNMGFNRVTLDRAGGDLFSAAAILPVCIRGGMAWRATVTLDTGNGPYVATFLFDTRAGR